MKQVSALFFCLMMMTMSLSGCLDSDEEEDSEQIESGLINSTS